MNKFRRGLYVELNVAIRHSVVGRTRERWVGNRGRVNRGNELPGGENRVNFVEIRMRGICGDNVSFEWHTTAAFLPADRIKTAVVGRDASCFCKLRAEF